MTTDTASGEGIAALPLLVWLSPGFPVGSFAYSHGLEWAIEARDITGAETLAAWLSDLIAHGGPRNDAILLAASWRTIEAEDAAALSEVNELALALAGSRERVGETVTQGNAFLAAIRAAWPMARIDGPAKALEPDIAYPVAVGLAAAAHGLELRATLEAYLTAVVANLVSAAVRLGAVGQTDGQRTIAKLLPEVRAKARMAETSSLDDLGGAAFRSDIAALRHETQYTRLFRS